MEIIYYIVIIALYIAFMFLCFGLFGFLLVASLFIGSVAGFFIGVFKGFKNYFVSLVENVRMRE